MSGKNLRILLIIFLGFVVLVAIKTILPRYRTEQSPYLSATSDVSRQSVGLITLSKGNEKVELKNESGTWKANGKNADRSKIESLLSFLFPETGSEMVAQSDTRHGELAVTEELGTKVVVDGKKTFVIGKTSGNGAFVRIDGSPNVYLNEYAPDITVNASDWYDTMVLGLDKTKITEVSFTEGRTTTSFVKENETWVRKADKKQVNTEKMDTVLFGLSGLRATSVFEEASKIWYPSVPAMSVTVNYDGKSESVEIFKGEEDYMIKRASDGEKFIASGSTVEPILKAPSDVLQ